MNKVLKRVLKVLFILVVVFLVIEIASLVKIVADRSALEKNGTAVTATIDSETVNNKKSVFVAFTSGEKEYKVTVDPTTPLYKGEPAGITVYCDPADPNTVVLPGAAADMTKTLIILSVILVAVVGAGIAYTAAQKKKKLDPGTVLFTPRPGQRSFL